LVCVSTLYDVRTTTHFSERIPVGKRRMTTVNPLLWFTACIPINVAPVQEDYFRVPKFGPWNPVCTLPLVGIQVYHLRAAVKKLYQLRLRVSE
jgi:hypothetical protein